jgi:AmmeMemoRadiSam system protein A
MHPIAKLAWLTIESYIREGNIPDDFEESEEMKERTGVFVSLKKHGELRGCIGTFEPSQKNVAQEVIHNAIASATQDPRFPPVSQLELSELEVSVDILSSPQEVKDISKLDPREYGVIVECGWRRGLLLPNLEGVNTVEEQIDICRRKAGILPSEVAKLYRFKVRRYK